MTTQIGHGLPVFDNILDRKFDVAQADEAYVRKFTYIWTQESWLNLVVYIDLCLSKLVGWSMGSRMRADLVCDALEMAIGQRQPGFASG